MAVSGVRSSCDTLATKSRRMTSSRRSSVTSCNTSTKPKASPSAPRSRAAFTWSVGPVPALSVTSREAILAPPASSRISSPSAGSRLSSTSGRPRGVASGGSARRSRARAFVRTTPPVRSVTRTPSTMPRRMASRRSRSTRSSPMVPPICRAISPSWASSSPTSSGRSGARYGGASPAASLPAKPRSRCRRRSSRRASTSAAPAATSSPTKRLAASSQRVWLTASPTDVSGTAARTTRVSPPCACRTATYSRRSPDGPLARIAWPLPLVKASRTSGSSSIRAVGPAPRAESHSTRPPVPITATCRPAAVEMVVHASWSWVPSAQGTAWPTRAASVVSRFWSASTSRRSSRIHSHGAATSKTPASAASVGTRNWRASLGLQRVGVELVSNTANRDDEFGGGIISFDPLAQAADVHVDGPWLDVHVLAPDQVQQLQAVVYPVWVAHEELEQFELAQREVRGLALDEDFVRVEVHTQATALEDLVRLRHVLAVRPSQHRLHPCHHLTRTARLRDVVVGAHLDDDHAIDLCGPGGEHDDGDGVGRLGAAQPSADLEAVRARQHDVQHDQSRSLARDLGQRALAGVRLTNRVAFLLEMKADELADVLLVLDDEDRSLE